MMRFFEEIRVGDRIELGSYLFTAQDIKTFAGQHDPQPFHLDEIAAAQSHFGGLCASGWHTASVWMRKMIDYRKREAEALQSRGERAPALGPSPGFKDMRWHKPVLAGDTIHYASEVVELRDSQSRPDWGLVRLRNTGVNQHGVTIMSFVGTVFIERRGRMPE